MLCLRLLDPKSSPLIRHEAQLQPHPAPDKELNSRQVSKAQRTRWRSAHRGTDKGARPHRAPPACAACPTGPGPLPNNTLQLATTCAPGAAAGTPGLLGDLQARQRWQEMGKKESPSRQVTYKFLGVSSVTWADSSNRQGVFTQNSLRRMLGMWEQSGGNQVNILFGTRTT